VQINVAADVFDVIVDGDAERDLVKNAAFNFGPVLNRFEDGVVAHSNAIDFDHRIFSHAGDVIIVKLRKRPFVFAHVGQNSAFYNNFGVVGPLKIVGSVFKGPGGVADEPAG